MFCISNIEIFVFVTIAYNIIWVLAYFNISFEFYIHSLTPAPHLPPLPLALYKGGDLSLNNFPKMRGSNFSH